MKLEERLDSEIVRLRAEVYFGLEWTRTRRSSRCKTFFRDLPMVYVTNVGRITDVFNSTGMDAKAERYQLSSLFEVPG